MPKFERHAFSGLDEGAAALEALLDTMLKQCFELLDYFTLVMDQPEKGYEHAKAIDAAINANEIEVNTSASLLIAKYAPMGEELRYIVSMLKVAYIYERVADNIKNSIKRRCRLAGPLPTPAYAPLQQLVQVVSTALHETPPLLADYSADGMSRVFEIRREASASYKQALAALHTMSPEGIAARDNSDMHFVIRNIERVSTLMLDLAKVGYYIESGQKYGQKG